MLFLTLAVAALGAGALAAPAGARVPRDFVGITSEDVFAGGHDYRDRNLSAQASLRIGLIRQNFDWAAIERRPGSYDLSHYDRFVAAAAAHGIRVLPILFNAPPFHAERGDRRGAYRPNAAAFALFATALVQRYGSNGSLWRENPGLRRLPFVSWQVWNEPNLPAYWQPRPSARQYTGLLKAAARAIKRVDRRAEIVTSGLPPSKLSGAVPLTRFIKQMYRAGAKRYFDTLAINSYARNQRELVRMLKSIRRLMVRSRDRKARLWITELGWAKDGPPSRFRVGPRGQAGRIRSTFRALRKLRRRLRLRGVVYYSWRDSPPYPPLFRDLWGLHTGLLDADGRPSPAFYAFQTATASLH
jgi:polysaccharide biosynthesis protein PslG